MTARYDNGEGFKPTSPYDATNAYIQKEVFYGVKSPPPRPANKSAKHFLL